MTRADRGTTLDGLTPLDLGRWAFALAVVAASGAGAYVLVQNYTPPAMEVAAAEPAMLIDLAPLAPPEPEPVVEPEPVAEPEPIVEPEPIEEPQPEPKPEVEQPPPEPEPPVEEPPPPEPVAEEPPRPEPVVEEEPLPEPEVVEPEPEPEPLPEPPPPEEPEPEVSPDLPMPMTLSPRLQRQREETPPTPRPQQQPRPQPQAQPQPQQQQPRQQQSAPSAPASTVSPQQWQQQVLTRIEARKNYPRASQAAGEEGVVVVSFTVSASGQIGSVGVARSSGFPALDQAAVQTARSAAPFPAPPAGVAGQTVTVPLRFTLR